MPQKVLIKYFAKTDNFKVQDNGNSSLDLISFVQFARSGERLDCCGRIADVFVSWEDVEVQLVSSPASGSEAMDVGQLVAVYTGK